MAQRGRKSTESLSIVPISPDIGLIRPNPPEKLTPAEAEIWKETVAAMRPDWFRACHSFRPWRNARRGCSIAPGDLASSTPMTGIAGCCCARAESGHAAAAPPRSVMNSRRFMTDIGLAPPRAAGFSLSLNGRTGRSFGRS
jgi:hypothetical protein